MRSRTPSLNTTKLYDYISVHSIALSVGRYCFRHHHCLVSDLCLGTLGQEAIQVVQEEVSV